MNRLQLAGAVALLLLSLGVFAARCACDPRIPFVTRDDSAPWIRFPTKATGLLSLAPRDAPPVTRFRRVFEMPAGGVPDLRLRARALRELALFANGERVVPPEGKTRHWRVYSHFELAGHLRPGTNELRAEVVNPTGPALLSLRLDGLAPPLVSDGTWQVSLAGGEWQPAVPADASAVNPSSYAMPSPAEGLRARADLLLACFTAGALLFLAALPLRGTSRARRVARLFPALVVLLWLGFLTRSLEIPLDVGFDARHHGEVVEFLRSERRLPLATDGWMMFQPPLYYLSTALLVEVEERLLTQEPARLAWKLTGWLAGLATALLCGALARQTFDRGSREVGMALGFAGLLPMNVYISSYVTNESLHTALACAVVVQTARLLCRGGAPAPRDVAAWAILLALAALTKYTAWIVGAVAGFFLAVRWLREEQAAPISVARRLALAGSLVCLLTGWFYARNWLHFGVLFPLNVDLPGQALQWWAPPGYRTPAYFLRFGAVLVHPFLAGYHAAWDSFYSTLWGDGQLGGEVVAARRHPYWDWELMAAGYWVALPATALLLVGAARSLRLALCAPDPGLRALHSFLLTLAWALVVSVLYMTLRQQDYAQAKAFYGLAGIAPLSVWFALGCGGLDRWLEARHATTARVLLYGWLGAFAGGVALSFAG